METIILDKGIKAKLIVVKSEKSPKVELTVSCTLDFSEENLKKLPDIIVNLVKEIWQKYRQEAM